MNEYSISQKQIARLAVLQMDECYNKEGREREDRQGNFSISFDSGVQGEIDVTAPWMERVTIDREGNVR